MDPDAPTPAPSAPADPSSDPAAHPDQPEEVQPTYKHRRTGFVAQLPEAVRNQINQLILDGVPYAQIPTRVGEPAKTITAEHIRTWARGGFIDWLRQRERKEDLRSARDSAADLLSEKAGLPVQDAGRTIAAAQLYELLQSFNPRSFADALVDKPELYLRLINTLSRLSEGEATCNEQRARESLLASKLLSEKAGPAKELVSQEKLKDILHQIKLV